MSYPWKFVSFLKILPKTYHWQLQGHIFILHLSSQLLFFLYDYLGNKNKKIAPLSFPESKMVILKAAQQNMKLTGLKL